MKGTYHPLLILSGAARGYEDPSGCPDGGERLEGIEMESYYSLQKS